MVFRGDAVSSRILGLLSSPLVQAGSAQVCALALGFVVLLGIGIQQTALRLWMEDSSLLAQLEEKIKVRPGRRGIQTRATVQLLAAVQLLAS